jgi:REP element-mobilizing transposase RayT
MNIRSQTIENGRAYHIFNRGNNKENLFLDNNDYNHFLDLLSKYILPVAAIYSWVLLRNHFHLVLQIRENIQYKWPKNMKLSKEANIWETELISKDIDRRRVPNASNHFKHLFNAYANYFNLKYNRTGSLFDKPFKRIIIEDERHLVNEILYTNSNSVKHGFSNDVFSWQWSSVNDMVKGNSKLIDVDYVKSLFGDIENFRYVLRNYSDYFENEFE